MTRLYFTQYTFYLTWFSFLCDDVMAKRAEVFYVRCVPKNSSWSRFSSVCCTHDIHILIHIHTYKSTEPKSMYVFSALYSYACLVCNKVFIALLTIPSYFTAAELIQVHIF